MEFSTILKKLMAQNDVTAYKVSKETGIPQAVIGRWKNGEQLPSSDNLRKIANYFQNEDFQYNLNPSYEPTNKREEVHNVIEPYADDENIAIFKDLQKLEGIGLVVPVGEEHMYYAAMNSKACKLTAVGKQYWHLVKEGRI